MKKADVKFGERYLAKFWPLEGACVTALEAGIPPGGQLKVAGLLVRVEVVGAGWSSRKVGDEVWTGSRNLVRPWTAEDDRLRETRAEARSREQEVLDRAKGVDPEAKIHNGRVLLSVDAVDELLTARDSGDKP